jgi:hypothetical protein
METEDYLDPVDDAAAQAAINQEESAPSETDAGVGTPPDEPEDKPAKGVQKRIDELVRQREEWKRQAEQWQQMAARQPVETAPSAQPEMPAGPPKPRSDDYETYDEYEDALADWKVEKKWHQLQQKQILQTRQQLIQSWTTKAEAKYPDWKMVFHNSLPVTQTMADVLLESEIGVELGYHLGKNPLEAARIAALPPHLQGRELGKLEAKIANAPPPQRNQTNAPTPTSPVGGRETPAKNPEDMSYEEYKAWRMAGGGK